MATLYLLKSGHGPNPLFKNHWALLIATSDDDHENLAGTFVHVRGDMLNGFNFQSRRHWNKTMSTDPYRAFAIGEVDAAALTINSLASEGYIPDAYLVDSRSRTPFEDALLQTPPPGPSLVSAASGSARRQNIELRDCQWWIRNALPNAVQAGYLTLNPDAEALLDVSAQ